MKSKIFLSILAMATFLLPATSHAAQFLAEDVYTVDAEQTVDEHVYLLTGSAFVNGEITEDLFVVTEDIDLEGTIGDDAYILAEKANVSGVIQGDLRALTAMLSIQGTIEGDLMVASGAVLLSEDAVIKGDVYLGAGEVELKGSIEGNIIAYTDQMKIDAAVQGDSELYVSSLALGEAAVLTGNLTYEATTEAEIANAAEVKGEVFFTQVTKKDDAFAKDAAGAAKEFFFGFAVVASVTSFLSLLALGLILYVLIKKPMQRVLDRGQEDFLESFLYGLAAFILFPFVILFLFLTIVGSKLAWLLLLFYMTSLLFAKLGAALLIGQYFLQAIQKEAYQFDWKTLVLGIVLVSVLKLIPFVGGLIVFVFMLGALGTGYQVASTWVKAQRS